MRGTEESLILTQYVWYSRQFNATQYMRYGGQYNADTICVVQRKV